MGSYAPPFLYSGLQLGGRLETSSQPSLFVHYPLVPDLFPVLLVDLGCRCHQFVNQVLPHLLGHIINHRFQDGRPGCPILLSGPGKPGTDWRKPKCGSLRAILELPASLTCLYTSRVYAAPLRLRLPGSSSGTPFRQSGQSLGSQALISSVSSG